MKLLNYFKCMNYIIFGLGKKPEENEIVWGSEYYRNSFVGALDTFIYSNGKFYGYGTVDGSRAKEPTKIVRWCKL